MKLSTSVLFLCFIIAYDRNAEANNALEMSFETISTVTRMLTSFTSQVKRLGVYEKKLGDAFAHINGISDDDMVKIRHGLDKIFPAEMMAGFFRDVVSPALRGGDDISHSAMEFFTNAVKGPVEGVTEIADVLLTSPTSPYEVYEKLFPVFKSMFYDVVDVGQTVVDEFSHP